MTYVYAPHEPDAEHLADVIEQMRTLGAPTIRAVWMGEYWLALEGSHRLAAAHALGLTPIIEELSYLDEIDHDCEEVESKEVGDLVEYLTPDNRTPTYDFDDLEGA